jgi:ATP:ADP antiporter, AAA family
MDHSTYKKLSWYPILAVSISMVSFIMIKSARDAVFFQHNGIFNLPLAYIWISIANIPLTLSHLRVISKYGARRSHIIVYIFSAALFLLFVPFVNMDNRLMMFILFILTPTLFSALFAGAWLLAADLLKGASQQILRKAYSRIGAGSMIGGIIGGLLARQLSGYVPTNILILIGAFFLLIVVGIFHQAYKSNPIANYAASMDNSIKQRSINKTKSMFKKNQQKHRIFKDPYIFTIVGIGIMTALTGLYIDFQFYATIIKSQNNNLEFFAGFYIVLNFFSLLLQLFIAPKFQKKFGIAGALTILPLALLGVSGIFVFWALAHSRAIIKVTETGLKSSVHRSTWEQVFIPISSKKRTKVKNIIDGSVVRISEGIGALILYFWLLFKPKDVSTLNLDWMTFFIFGFIVFWIFLNQHLKKLGCNTIDSVEPRLRLPDS